MTYNFTTKAEYLEATTMWKADFKAHITLIRQLKRDFKAAQRVFSKHGAYDYGWSSVQKNLYHDDHRPMEQLRDDLRRAGEKTIELGTARLEMKVEAQRQYLARTT